jgi:hypothetical protein
MAVTRRATASFHMSRMRAVRTGIPVHTHLPDILRPFLIVDLLVIPYPCNTPSPMRPAGVHPRNWRGRSLPGCHGPPPAPPTAFVAALAPGCLLPRSPELRELRGRAGPVQAPRFWSFASFQEAKPRMAGAGSRQSRPMGMPLRGGRSRFKSIMGARGKASEAVALTRLPDAA